jgi:putative FmdB family regulatory protein
VAGERPRYEATRPASRYRESKETMPLYEYRCQNCGRKFEVIQKFSDPLAEHCPSCGQGPVEKLMSSPAIKFKGSGWYVTDYAKKDNVGAGKSDTSSAERKSTDSSSSEKKSTDTSSSTETSTSPSGDKSSKKD